MTKGPSLDSLLKHLADCPPVFLRGSRPKDKDGIAPHAVLSDLLEELRRGDAERLDGVLTSLLKNKNENQLRSMQLAAWLFFHPWFREATATVAVGDGFLELCENDLASLAAHVPAEQWVRVGERMEELSRLALRRCGVTPERESEALAADRLAAVSTLARQELTAKTTERNRAIRAAMAERAAREAANVYGRE